MLASGTRANAHTTDAGLDGEERDAPDGRSLHSLGEAVLVPGEMEMRGKEVVRREVNLMHSNSQQLVDQLAPRVRVGRGEHSPKAPRPVAKFREFVVEVHDANQRTGKGGELAGMLHEGASMTNPDGGMFLWARLGNDIDTSHLLPLAVEEGVAFVPGSAFYAHDPDPTTLRLSFVTNSPHVIAEGIQRLSRAIKIYSTQRGPAPVY